MLSRLVCRQNRGANGSKNAASSGSASGEALGTLLIFMLHSTTETNKVVLGGLLSQLSLGFQLDQLHQVLNHHIALEFLAFLFGQRAVTLGMDKFVCSFGHLGRWMERHDLFRSGMIREKPCDFRRGLRFEQHHDSSFSNASNTSCLMIHQEHTTEETVLQKHR